MARDSNIAPNRNTAHPFDLRYGTDTGGYLAPEQLGGGERNDAMNNGYSAVAPSVFREACRLWRETLPISAARVEAFTFVDVGAGKGRALLLASQLPFRKALGIELNEELARIATENVRKWSRIERPRTKIRVLHQDAATFRWPAAPVLVYLNNPFECELVEQLATSLATAARSGPGLLDIIYVNPGCAETFAQKLDFKVLWNTQIQMDEADQDADPYGATSDRVTAFRCSAKHS